ncbi:transcription factor TGAL4-like isoform X2 [Wolffia australiana]
MGSVRNIETGLSESGPSNQALGYGVHAMPSAANFFNQQGSTYFGELEEALMQRAPSLKTEVGRRPFSPASRPPPTLEIFPSWPMNLQQPPRGNSQSAESTDSGSGRPGSSSPERRSSSSGQPPGMAVVTEDLPGMAAVNGGHSPRTQEKRKFADKDGRPLDAKTLRRLAQNREAARKSRLRKKAYVQQLESSRIKLSQIEQELQRARSQGLFLAGGAGGNISPGAAIFQMEYARWLDEEQKHMSKLRAALLGPLADGDLRAAVDDCIAHYDDMFQIKSAAAKADVFYLITGMWTSPAERCFLWIGGFRPSDMIKILTPQLDPLTDQQVMGIYNLQQSSQQAEEALSQGLEQLQQSLADTVASDSLSDSSNNVGNYMDQMSVALSKVASLESFVRQVFIPCCCLILSFLLYVLQVILFFFPSFSLSLSLPISISLHLSSIYLSFCVSLSLCLSVSLYIFLTILFIFSVPWKIFILHPELHPPEYVKLWR